MPKGCPILRLAWLIVKGLKGHLEIISIEEARCLGTYCGIWDEGRGKCGLITREATNDRDK